MYYHDTTRVIRERYFIHGALNYVELIRFPELVFLPPRYFL